MMNFYFPSKFRDINQTCTYVGRRCSPHSYFFFYLAFTKLTLSNATECRQV